MHIESVQSMADKDLKALLSLSLSEELSAITTSLACLVELVARDIPCREGAKSLWYYLVNHLGFSESNASKRNAAVKAIAKFPDLLALVGSGHLHLSHLSLISRYLVADNKDLLVEKARSETHKGLEEYLAMKFRKSPGRDSKRPVVVPPRLVNVETQPALLSASPPSEPSCAARSGQIDLFARAQGGPSESTQQPTGVPPPVPTQQVVSIGSRVSVTLDHESSKDLDYLVRSMPRKTLGDILGLAVSELRNRRDPERAAARTANRKAAEKRPVDRTSPAADIPVVTPVMKMPNQSLVSAHIPAALRRAVLQRDGYQCTYVSPGGRRCEACHQLEIDHVTPRAFGGENSFLNLRSLCRSHNALAAKDLMGKAFIESHYIE